MRLIPVFLLALPCFALADIYRCPGEGGKLTFSDHPCAGAMESADRKIDVTPQNITDPLATKKQIEEQQKRARQARSTASAAPTGVQYCQSYSSTALRTLEVSNTVEPGMPRSSAIAAWGPPTAINGGRPEQLVYRWPSSTSYIYIVDGCVWQVDGGYGR